MNEAPPWTLVIGLLGAAAYFGAILGIDRWRRPVRDQFRRLAAQTMAAASSPADRAIVLYYVHVSAGSPPMVMFVFLLPAIVIAAGVFIIMKPKPQHSHIRTLNDLEAATVRRAFEVDPRRSGLWRDPRRIELAVLSEALAVTEYPTAVFAAALYGWALVPLAAVLFLAAMIGGQDRRSVLMQYVACVRATALAMRKGCA